VNRFRTIALTAVTGFVLVACGPAASGGSEEPGHSEAAASQAQASSDGGPEPSFTAGAVSELEDIIPDTVGDLTIEKESLRGSEFLVDADSDPAQVKFVEDLGVSPEDISIATGSATNADFSEFLFLFVIRAEGSDGDRLKAAFLTASAQDGVTPPEWVDATVGGKSVETATSNGATSYLYTSGDILIWLIATPDELAGDFFSQL
jgi:hypothetical protein